MKNLITLDSPILIPARVAAKVAFRLANQLLHPARCYRARRRLRAMGGPRKILIVCTGNVCRSPYAEVKAREVDEDGLRWEVRSAGWMGPSGRAPPMEAVDVARERGLDLDGHRSQLLSEELVGWADLLLVMERGHAKICRDEFRADGRRILLLGDLDPDLPRRREVPDPWGLPRGDFEDAFDRIDRCLNELSLLTEPGW
jgi:protein-tyrosine-phosphatase